MAVTFQLTDGTNTISFTSATDFHLIRPYSPKIAMPTGDGSIPPYITEVIPVIIKCTSEDNLAATLQKFHAMQRLAAEYWVDPQQKTPLWLQCKLDGETAANVRQVLVKSLGLEFTNNPNGLYDVGAPALEDGRFANVVVVRHPYWERTVSRDFPEDNTNAGCIMTYDPTSAGGGGTPAAHDIVGDVGARIEELRVGSTPYRLWMGVRSAGRHGTLANFVETWECEGGINGSADWTDDVATDVNGASPGSAAGA